MSWNSLSSHCPTDAVLVWCLRGVAGLASCVVLAIGVFLILEAMPALRAVGLGRFVTDRSWHPTEGLFRLTPILVGTLCTTLGAGLLATPIGLLSAIFCHCYAPRPLAYCYRRLIEVLAGLPSVVYGLWGLEVLVPIVGQIHPPGQSLLAAILILTLMSLPTVTLVADTSLASVPRPYLDGAAALALSRWTTVRHIALPAAKPGLYAGLLLSMGRVTGETLAVMMVCGNVVQMPTSVFDPIRTLTTNMALEMAYAMGSHRSALFVTGLVGLVTSIILVVAALWLSQRKTDA